MNNIYSIIFSLIIIFFGSMTQGAIGFGFSLIAVPLLNFVLPMKIIVPTIVICSVVINIMVVAANKKHMRLSEIWIMIVCGVIGIPIGVYGLKHLDTEVLKCIMGILICITAIAMIKGYKIKFKRVKISYGMTGFISGILNGSVSMSGPPIVLFLNNEGYNKNEFKANLAMYGVIINIITIITFVLNDLISIDMMGTIVADMIVLLAGTYIGIKISSKIEDKYFKKMVLWILTIVGVVTVLKVII